MEGNARDERRPDAPGARRPESLGRLRRTRRRTFYSIGEVCSMIGIKPHVLRYWESRFTELAPTKNRAGNRVYQKEEIELIALIHRLVNEERYTVDGARIRLAELQAEGSVREQSTHALQRAYLARLGGELALIDELLDPDGS